MRIFATPLRKAQLKMLFSLRAIRFGTIQRNKDERGSKRLRRGAELSPWFTLSMKRPSTKGCFISKITLKLWNNAFLQLTSRCRHSLQARSATFAPTSHETAPQRFSSSVTDRLVERARLADSLTSKRRPEGSRTNANERTRSGTRPTPERAPIQIVHRAVGRSGQRKRHVRARSRCLHGRGLVTHIDAIKTKKKTQWQGQVGSIREENSFFFFFFPRCR